MEVRSDESWRVVPETERNWLNHKARSGTLAQGQGGWARGHCPLVAHDR